MAPGLGPWLLALWLAAGPAGVWAQVRLVESGGGLRAPGGSVLLSCRGSGFDFGSYAIRWYRQAPGGSLEWVSYISYDSSVTKFGQSVEGRATASRDNSRSESSLSLRALNPRTLPATSVPLTRRQEIQQSFNTNPLPGPLLWASELRGEF